MIWTKEQVLQRVQLRQKTLPRSAATLPVFIFSPHTKTRFPSLELFALLLLHSAYFYTHLYFLLFMLQMYVDGIGSAAVRSLMKFTTTTAATPTMPIMSTMIEGTIGAIVIILMISLVAVIIKVCSRKRRYEKFQLEMSPSTPSSRRILNWTFLCRRV